MASIPGGPADKLGNEFERLWTIRHLIQVIAGRASSITIEALGDDERGTEFWVSRLDGTREAHQCKRENGSNGDWSVSELNAKKILSNAKFQLDQSLDHRFVFVSADKAPSMADLCERSRRGDSTKVFCEVAVGTSAKLKAEFEALCRYLNFDVNLPADQERIRNYLRHFNVRLVDKAALRAEIEGDASAWLTGNPSETVSQLESFVSRNETMGRVLRDIDILAALPTGANPRDLGKDATLPLKIRDLQDRFDRSYRHLLIGGAPLGRAEVGDLLAKLTASDGPRLVLLHGPGATGKTGVVFEFALKLVENDIPFLPLRLDRDKPLDSPAQYGGALGLPASPSTCLATYANGRNAVLILDQLDALRWTATHSAHAWDTCERIINEALRHRNLRVVVVCRTFDVEDDPRIRAWKQTEGQRVTEIKVSGLDEPILRRVLERVGGSFDTLNGEQRRILRSPQSLYLWLQLFGHQKRAPSFNTTVELMEMFWEYIRTTLPVPRDHLQSILETLAEDMDRRGLPFSDQSVVSKWPDEKKALISANVLTTNGRQLLFSHQSYLDYLTAERISRDINSGKLTISGWLAKNEQSLFRRGQLRQLLSLLRDQDKDRFISTLQELITSPNMRFHLRHLALQVLANAEVPTGKEINFVIGLLNADQWRNHVVQHVISGRPQWFDAVNGRGVFKSWLMGADGALQNECLWVARTLIEIQGDAVSSLILTRGQPRLQRAKAILWAAKPAQLKAALFRAFLALVRRGNPESLDFGWETLARENPERAILLFKQRISHVLDNTRKKILLSTDSGRGDHHISNNEVIPLCDAARQLPEFAWRHLMPVLRRSCALARRFRRRKYDASSFGIRQTAGIHQRALIRVLTACGKVWAKNKPAEFCCVVERLGPELSRPTMRIVTRSLGSMPNEFAEFAIHWLIRDARRLRCGTPDRGSYHEATAYTPAVRLFKRFGAVVDPELFNECVLTIRRFIPAYELRDFRYRHEDFMANPKGRIYPRSLFVSQCVLLSALPTERLSQETSGWLGVLRRKFGDPESIMKPRSRMGGGFVGSTVPQEKIAFISDRQWLNIVSRDWSSYLHKHRQLGPDSVGEVSHETLSRDLGYICRIDPGRIATLALRFPPGIDPQYIGAILRAFAETKPPEKHTGEWQPASVPVLEAVVARFSNLLINRDIAMSFCWMVEKRPHEPWTDTTFEKLISFALTHPDPQPADDGGADRDVTHLSINCVRGIVAETIAVLLYGRAIQHGVFQRAIDALVADSHVAVRAAAIGIAVAFLNIDRNKARDLFLRACAEADDRVLESHHLDRFLSYTLFEFPDQLRPIVERMIKSKIDDVSERGAAWATEAWAHRGIWKELFFQCVAGSIPQRRGVAKNVIRAVLDNRGGDEARSMLFALFDDPEQEVRDLAAGVFRYDAFFTHGSAVRITERFMQSKAFENNIDDFLYGIHDETISLQPFASILKQIAISLVSPTGDSKQHVRRTTGTGILAGLLLRLYEQSADDALCRGICLDAWDELLQHFGYGVLEKIDA